MTKNKISFINAISALLLTLVNGLLGIIVTKLIIEYFGSDFNGLNSTANQIINVLLVLEGGFTLASNVVLFKPLGEKDYNLLNNILFITRRKFHRIAVLFLFVGVVVSSVYTFLINSTLPSNLVFMVVFMAIIPAAFNLFYATTYRVLIQTMQKEYVINFVNMITIGLGHIANILMILNGGSVWLVRTITMVFAIINSLILVIYTKKTCEYLDIKDNGYNVIIPGTRDVLVQKITGVIYSSAPIVFLSISSSGGTVLASVYAVYNNIILIIKSLLRSIIDAPRLSIGQVIATGDYDRLRRIFEQYEFISLLAIFVTCSTTYPLILPFISIYTSDINDVNYYDKTIAVLMILTTVFEMVHIPSGNLINMAGKFKESMYFQVITCIVLLISMTVGGYCFGIYGLIFSVLLVAVILCVFEIGYVHVVYFRSGMSDFIRKLVQYSIIGIAVAIIEEKLIEINGYLQFFLYGIVIFTLNIGIGCLISVVFDKKLLISIIHRCYNLIKKENK